MKISIYKALVFIVIVFLSNAGILAQDYLETAEYSMLNDLWNRHEYSTFITIFRNSSFLKKRTAEVDYWLATSYCQLKQCRAGMLIFKKILKDYQLSQAQKQIVIKNNALCQCETSLPAANPTIIERTIIGPGFNSPGGELTNECYGKIYYQVFKYDKKPLNKAFGIKKKIDENTFKTRIYPTTDPEAAKEFVKKLVSDYRSIISTKHFILTSHFHNENSLRDLGIRLENFLQFICFQYGFSFPDRFITVYIEHDPYSLKKLAENLHGIEIPYTCIGYSFARDRSIVAVVSFVNDDEERHPRTGTIQHELLHLLVRENFNDIPAWLEEGIASLYEVTDAHKGESNWRVNVLKENWDKRPSIEALLRMDFDEFNDRESPGEKNIIQLSVNHATARYFCFFLEMKGKLKQIFDSIRKSNPIYFLQDNTVDFIVAEDKTDAIMIVQNTLGMSIVEIEKDFLRWLNSIKNHPIH